MYKNKVHLRVKPDKNGWFMLRGANYRVQLCGNKELGGFFLPLYAKRLGKDRFMQDLTEIFEAMSKDKQSAFTLYELDYEKDSLRSVE